MSVSIYGGDESSNRELRRDERAGAQKDDMREPARKEAIDQKKRHQKERHRRESERDLAVLLLFHSPRHSTSYEVLLSAASPLMHLPWCISLGAARDSLKGSKSCGEQDVLAIPAPRSPLPAPV